MMLMMIARADKLGSSPTLCSKPESETLVDVQRLRTVSIQSSAAAGASACLQRNRQDQGPGEMRTYMLSHK